ncbi:MAG TPA: DUF6805 domain-containing protein [Vicinamibacterales bacterium]
MLEVLVLEVRVLEVRVLEVRVPRVLQVGLLLVCAWGVAGLTSGGSLAQGLRVVDAVDVGSPASEQAHHYRGVAAFEGRYGSRNWRASREWFEYTVRVYDDTPVTLVCVWADPVLDRPTFDIMVEDATLEADASRRAGSEPCSTTVSVPDALTRGRTAITVRFRARAGKTTPGLVELRVVQEHLEQAAAAHAGRAATESMRHPASPAQRQTTSRN